MKHTESQNQDSNAATKAEYPPRETSESFELDEIEKLLATQRQTDEALAQKKESLRARLSLLEEATADGSRRKRCGSTSAAICGLQSAVYCGIAIVALVGVLLLGQYIGGNHNSKPVPSPTPIPAPVPSPIPEPSGLTMTEREAELVRQAIDLVREDVDGLQTTARVLSALRSHLPSRVREAVMKEFGEPDMEFMRDALDILEGKLL